MYVYLFPVIKYDHSRPWVSSADPLSHIHRIQFHPNQSLLTYNNHNIINCSINNNSNNNIINPTIMETYFSPSNTIPSSFLSTSPSYSILPLTTFASWERDYQISRTQLLEHHHLFWSRNNSNYEALKSDWIHSCNVVFS